VRYRIDGMLKEVMVLPKAVGVPLVSRIKIMSQMDIADRLRPQGGRARVSINGARVDLRVSTLPASHGEKVVIRILDSRAALRSVESLGLDPVDGRAIKNCPARAPARFPAPARRGRGNTRSPTPSCPSPCRADATI